MATVKMDKEPARRTSTFLKRANFVFLCLAVALLLATVFLSAVVGPYTQDPDYFTYVGRCLAKGRRLYFEIWDCKGPIMYWLSAVGALFGPVMGFQVVGAFAWLLAFSLVFVLSRRFCGAYSGLAVFMFALFALGVNRFGTTGRQESVAACFVAGGMLLGLGRMNPLRCFGAGVCAGFVLMIKPTLLMFAPAIGCWWAMSLYRNREWGVFLKSCAFAVAGGVFALLAVTAFFLPDGVPELWRGALLWNLTERNVHSVPLFKYWKCVLAMRTFVEYYGWTIYVWGACYVAAVVLAIKSRSREMAFLVLWSTLEAVAVFGYPGFCAHYIIMAFMPLAIAIGCGLNKCGMSLVSSMSLVLTGCAMCFTVAWSCPRIFKHIASSEKRHASFVAIKDELKSGGGGVVVYGANRTAHVMNAINALSDQRFPGIRFWISATTQSFREELAADFRKAADADDACMLLVEQPCNLDEICAMTGWNGLDKFKLWKEFPELEVAVYRKCCSSGDRNNAE